uniref:Uncharacterized protein n=1 Tax=Siphoviridae sp. ctd9R8 TaxID=2825576 RepID=A0A8S5PV08_9CAUD|nr:MAG TPA: hypothetical protein [Siphoviridae sp. ctd9R8]
MAFSVPKPCNNSHMSITVLHKGNGLTLRFSSCPPC